MITSKSLENVVTTYFPAAVLIGKDEPNDQDGLNYKTYEYPYNLDEPSRVIIFLNATFGTTLYRKGNVQKFKMYSEQREDMIWVLYLYVYYTKSY